MGMLSKPFSQYCESTIEMSATIIRESLLFDTKDFVYNNNNKIPFSGNLPISNKYTRYSNVTLCHFFFNVSFHKEGSS